MERKHRFVISIDGISSEVLLSVCNVRVGSDRTLTLWFYGVKGVWEFYRGLLQSWDNRDNIVGRAGNIFFLDGNGDSMGCLLVRGLRVLSVDWGDFELDYRDSGVSRSFGLVLGYDSLEME